MSTDGWTSWAERSQSRGDPVLSVYPTLDAWLSAVADEQWFADADRVTVHIGPDEQRLALEPDDDGTHGIYREREHGGDVSIKSVLRRLGIDEPDESVRLPIEWDAERGWGVVELTPLRDRPDDVADKIVEDVTAAASPDGNSGGQSDTGDTTTGTIGPADGAASDSDADAQYECDADGCDYTTDSKRGLAIHRGRTHDQNDAEDGSESDAEAADPSPAAQAAGDCETVQELADALDVSVGVARTRARKAGVYSDLQDQVDRPGVSR